MAAAVGEALDALGHRRAVLLGHSYGTLVASRFAKLYPERVHAMVLLDAGGRAAGVVCGRSVRVWCGALWAGVGWVACGARARDVVVHQGYGVASS